MDKFYIELILLAGGAVLASFQWLIKTWVKNLETNLLQLQGNQKEIDKEIKVIKETYVPKIDLKDLKEEIITRLERRLERIENHLMKEKDV